ncbi:hypothetical protein E4188_17120 [Aeromonas media]|uniref:Uncharacterized protein n=1 Tax=Aeromonas media TaxID=651 RepID=A0ABX6NW27_AERME|nr:hypothetical protein [Aeromonas media]QJT34465.1 hypothetical protein E4187_08965 [Aeromonas media]QJT40041.1 hypothetical protein E4188_17120 [Aeromonas media]
MLTAIMLMFSTAINVYALLQIRRSARALDAIVASQMKLKEIYIAQQVSVPAHEFSINELRGSLERARH